MLQRKRRIAEFIVDETLFKVRMNMFGFGLLLIQQIKQFLIFVFLLKELCLLQNAFWKIWLKDMVSDQFQLMVVPGIHKRAISWNWSIIYIHTIWKKYIIERTIQYIKDRTECFDDYFSCRKYNCKLEHVMHWLNLFIDMHNEMLFEKAIRWTEPI